MDSEKTKKVVELAELELQREEEQKQIDLVKRAIKQTLENIKQKEKDRDKLNKEIKTLKQDIDNIRAGRLDLIAERQEKDDEAKRTSVIEVIKEKEIHHYHYHDRWYEPYRIIWKYDYPYSTSGTYITANTIGWTDAYISDSNTIPMTFTNSIVKDASVGTYLLNSIALISWIPLRKGETRAKDGIEGDPTCGLRGSSWRRIIMSISQKKG